MSGISKLKSCESAVKPLEKFSAEGIVNCTSCGKSVKMQILVKEDRIVAAGAELEGCAYSLDSMRALIETVQGMDVYEAMALSNTDIHPRMQKVLAKLNCDSWVVAALKIALRNWRLRYAA